MLCALGGLSYGVRPGHRQGAWDRLGRRLMALRVSRVSLPSIFGHSVPSQAYN